MFNIDWNKFVEHHVPKTKRVPVIFAFIHSVLKPIKDLHTTFLSKRSEDIYEVIHTSQTIYLEKLLNDAFDPTNREIYIDNTSDDLDKFYVYTKAESIVKYMYTNWSSTHAYVLGDFVWYNGDIWECNTAHTNEVPGSPADLWDQSKVADYMYTNQDYDSGYDFIVFVKTTLVYDQNQLKSLLNKYKLASKRYIIQTY